MFTFPEVDINSIMCMTSLTVPKITKKMYVSYRVLGFQSHINLTVSHVTKWLSRALMWL